MGYNSSSLLINEPPMQFLPTLAIVLENNNKALFLQQMQYLLTISRNVYDGERWVYNTMSEWNMIFPMLSQRTLKRTIEDLKTCNIDGEIFHLIKTKKINHGGLNYRTYYTIDRGEMERLAALAMQKKIIKRREIVLSTIHMLNDYERYAGQFPHELPEKLIDLIKWAVKNNILINEKWCISDEGKAILEKVANAKCQNVTPEVTKWPTGEVKEEIIRHEASNNNESAILSSHECQADTSECQADIFKGTACHSPSDNLALPTIIQKTYTKNTNIDLETQEKKYYHEEDDDKGHIPDDVRQVVKLFSDNNAHKRELLPLERKKIIEFCRIYSVQWVTAAIEQAVMYDHPTLQYINRILDGWKEYGFKVKPTTFQTRSKTVLKVKRESEPNPNGNNKSDLDSLSSLPANDILNELVSYYDNLSEE